METILILREIIKTEMSLNKEAIFIYNQEVNFQDTFNKMLLLNPPQKIIITLQQTTSKVFSNNNYIVQDSLLGLKEEQNMIIKENYLIDILSQTDDARKQKEKIIFALNSTYSKQLQEKYGINIFRIPSSFNNLSELEGPLINHRYETEISVISSYNQTKGINYYNTFETESQYEG
jgi:hypothetical protein